MKIHSQARLNCFVQPFTLIMVFAALCGAAVAQSTMEAAMIHLNQISAQKAKAEAHVLTIKRQFANDPAVLADARNRYIAAAAGFVGWADVLELATIHKKKKFLKGPEFLSMSEKAVAGSTAFVNYAEGLGRVERSENAQRIAGQIDELMAISNAARRDVNLSPEAQMSKIIAAPDPVTISIVASVAVDVGFKVYDEISKRQLAERTAFAAEMKKRVVWANWDDIGVAPASAKGQ